MTARPMGPPSERRRPARPSFGIRITRATAPPVKTGIRRGRGFLRPRSSTPTDSTAASDATRLVAHLDTFDLVVGARSVRSQASAVRRIGNAMLNATAGFLAEAADSGSDVRLSRGSPRLPARVHPSPAQRLFDADDDDAGLYPRRATASGSSRWRPAHRQGKSKIRLGSDGLRFALILLKVITIFSPMRIFLPISLTSPSRSAARIRRLDHCHAVARDKFLGAAHPDQRGDFPGRPRVRADLARCASRAPRS